MVMAIVDDHPLIRQGVMTILQSSIPDLDIINFDCAESIFEHLQHNKVDYAIVDIFLKEADGFDLLQYIRDNEIDTKCIVFTSSEDYRDYRHAVNLGVEGYVLKGSLPEDLIYAVKTVIRGRRYIDPFFAETELDDATDILTKREYEVFELIGKGCNNTEIAEQLFISINTVKKHVSQIFSKLDIKERTQAALMASNHFSGRTPYKKSIETNDE